MRAGLVKLMLCQFILITLRFCLKGGLGMIYCISDIRGEYERFSSLLKKLHFNSRDTLYVLGNVIDGGEGSMKLLLDLMMRENVYPVIGEHEYAALSCLKWLMNDVTHSDVSGMDSDMMQRMAEWAAIGGQQTIAEFRALDEEQREMVVDYLSEFSLYEEVKAGGKQFVLVHAGINNFSEDKDLDEYDIRELLTAAPDYSRTYFADKTLVTGHTPTRRICEELNPLIDPTPDGTPSPYDKIFIESGHVAINCGVDIGGRLAAVRLDDMTAFYA